VTERDAKQQSRVTLLDCTLRDGGYYNDWDFSPTLIQRYVRTMSEARVPIVELGFRTLERGRYLGPAAYTTDRLLESLDLPDDVTYGVMVNAKEVVAGGSPRSAVDALFRPASDSRVQLVRIAANFSELDALAPAVEQLHHLGYDVGVNLMQIASRTTAEIEHFGVLAAQWRIAVAYVADSFGGMQPQDVSATVSTLRAAFAGPVGCHMHDNMSLAFANSLAAIEGGATFVDSTVLGMGRGPGNARTEFMAFELTRRGLAELHAEHLVSLVSDEFSSLQAEFGWGSSIYYFLSAVNGIHPTYIQEMTKDGRYSVDDVVKAVHELSIDGGASFNRDRLEAAAGHGGLITATGSYDASGWCAGKSVLIVGPGPTGVERRNDIEDYIRAQRPIVIALNAQPPVDPALVDVYAICHPVRALIDAELIAALDRPVFMPQGVADHAAPGPRNDLLRDYGVAASPATLVAGATACVVPQIASFPYAIALASVGGCEAIFLTGFDGFAASDPRQMEMDDLFELCAQTEGIPVITALTRTKHPIRQSSIYAD